jgi:hypothetical protein
MLQLCLDQPPGFASRRKLDSAARALAGVQCVFRSKSGDIQLRLDVHESYVVDVGATYDIVLAPLVKGADALAAGGLTVEEYEFVVCGKVIDYEVSGADKTARATLVLSFGGLLAQLDAGVRELSKLNFRNCFTYLLMNKFSPPVFAGGEN